MSIQKEIQKYMVVYKDASPEELKEYYRTSFSHKMDAAFNATVADCMRKNTVIGILVITIFILLLIIAI